VLAPPGLAYFLQPTDEAKVSVVIELTDATRQGIKTDDSGNPVFVAPDPNVESFSRNITGRTEYVDRLGHPVEVITSVMRLKDLKVAEEGGISPPTDIWKIPPEASKKGYNVPYEAISPVAKFRFVVEDRAGMRSDAKSERCVLFIGFPREVFVPPVPEPEKPSPGGTKKPQAPAKPPN